MTHAERKQRLIRIESWLHGPADSFGECDECHNATVALWVDLDTEEEGQFEYCRTCWEHRRKTIKDRLARPENANDRPSALASVIYAPNMP